MGKLYLAHVVLGAVLLFGGRVDASVHGDTRPNETKRAHQLVDAQLPKPAPSNAKLFSNVMLDPARCNYEYVEMHGSMVVRTELKLTCTTHY